MQSLRILLVLFFIGNALTLPTFAQKLEAPLPIETVLAARSFPYDARIDLSPDGQWIAYTLRDAQRIEPAKDERFGLFTRTGASIQVVGCDVWITNTESRESKNLSEGKGTSWGPVWSPDGRYLAFYSDRSGQANLWVWERSSGRLRKASGAIVRPYFGWEVVRWTPDSRKILTKALPTGMNIEGAANLIEEAPKPSTNPREQTRATVVVYSSFAAPTANSTAHPPIDSVRDDASTNQFLGDLVLVDLASGEIERIARNFKPRGYWISPDGALIAFTSLKGFEGGDSQQLLYDLVVVSLSTGQTRIVSSNIRIGFNGLPVSWSPDSQFLSYTTSGPKADGNCFIVAASGGKPHKLTEAKHPSFGDEFRGPLWDSSGQHLYFLSSDTLWQVSVMNGTTTPITTIPNRTLVEVVSPAAGRVGSPDGGRSMYITTRDGVTKQMGFYKVDVRTGGASKLLEENKAYSSLFSPAIFRLDISDDGQKVAYLSQDAQHYVDIWIAGMDFKNPKQVTNVNPQLDHYAMGASRVIEWRSTDEQVLRGALLLPANYEEGKRYPLIVNLYGGSLLSDNANQFGLSDIGGADNMQLLATRGYVVLYPDTPLQTGTPMQDLVKTVMPGVNRLIEMGIADPDRLGVTGQSYGGYSTLALIVQTTRFKAAIMRGGYGNLISAYGRMRKDGSAWGTGWAERGQGRMGGTPWEYRSRYIENSPVFYLDRTQTPLLIVHGSMDSNVQTFLAEEVFVDLRRLGREVVYAKYEGEDHWENAWGYANQLDFCNRMIEWFDDHLKKPEDRKPAEKQR